MVTSFSKNDSTVTTSATSHCYHCGEQCETAFITLEDKSFCCEGCKMVYEILNTNNLSQFYKLEKKPGISFKGKRKEEFSYLDDATIVEQLIDFEDEQITKVTFSIPQIHCASCIWLLENLYQLQDAIQSVRVNFLKKEVYITYTTKAISYRQVVELLASIGYNPSINWSNLTAPKAKAINKRFYYQLGVAGFAFGNIMLMSLPEYFGLEDGLFKEVFGYLNIVLILPVLLFSSRDYMLSAWQGIQQRQLNIDVPITIGIITLFARSLFEIVSQTGAGYIDSLAGLVFFLLIGKWFQQKTYHQLSFERDYKSYFPIATTIIKKGIPSSVALSQLKIGAILLIRSNELIPADGILIDGEARIDYSFVTGESEPVQKAIGEKVYAGGKQQGGMIKVQVAKKITQSYLTQLWNEDVFQKDAPFSSTITNVVGTYFTIGILFLAFATLFYWLPTDTALAINAFTAVLIIACPCAIALAVPFTLGNTLRLLSQKGFYLKNTAVLERINQLNTIIFDKTGTITISKENKLQYEGATFSEEEQQAVFYLTQQSAHPISQQINKYFKQQLNIVTPLFNPILDFKEIVGQGIYGRVGDLELAIEKGQQATNKDNPSKKGTIIQINGAQKGIILQQNKYRKGFERLIEQWHKRYTLYLLSGDNDRERHTLEQYLPQANLFFEKSPIDKLNFIKARQQNSAKVLMLGDGLNDAGALQQADVGIVVSENTNNFTPACDGIIDARQFEQLPSFLEFARQSIKIVYASYFLALIYNVIGLSFAVTGTLSPVIAAILMPLSSISIVLFGVGMTYLLQPRYIR